MVSSAALLYCICLNIKQLRKVCIGIESQAKGIMRTVIEADAHS